MMRWVRRVRRVRAAESLRSVRSKLAPLLGFALWLGFIQPSRAYDLPTVNLGLTSFLDGVLPSGPGLYYQNYTEYYTSDEIEDAGGDRLPLPRESLGLWANVSQLTYYMSERVGPGRLAFDVVIPTVVSAHVNDGLGNAVLDTRTGLSDILFAPIYQLDPVTLPNHWTLHQSLEFDVLAPTGSYDRRVAINPGENVWALDPFYSVTLFFTPRLSVSGRFHYLYSYENDEPPVSVGARATTLQPGEAFHVNLAAAYALTPRVGVGVNGYYLKQLTDTRIDGVTVVGRSERVLGVGPGALLRFDRDDFLFLNAYFESLVQNRTRGDRFVLRYVHHF